VASLAAAGTFAAAVALAGLPATPVVDASGAAPVTTPIVADPMTGERVVLDTVYIVTPAPVSAPAAAAPEAAPAERDDGDGEHEWDDHDGGEDHDGGDD